MYNDISVLDAEACLSFTDDHHVEAVEASDANDTSWRVKDKIKTASIALVVCLNIGVDPPDVAKTLPCARLECWMDPLAMPTKALDNIGTGLQLQYERWQPRARIKHCLDPTTDDVKKLCISLRRHAKEERVLFHYNGHGVPKPTSNGEIWVFNRTFTQYIPLSIYDLQSWMGSPSIYVYDCSNAGIIVESFNAFAQQHQKEYEQVVHHHQMQATGSSQPPNYSNCIQLAACAVNQILPMNPKLPADLFTACLTTPIHTAIRWYFLQSSANLSTNVPMDLIDRIPGTFADRRSMLGELNWIFTSIMDSIAWHTLPKDAFKTLFRQDLLVTNLFRNFLLAERILKSCDCTPISSPVLPPTWRHPLWQKWDMVLDETIRQLPGIMENNVPYRPSLFFEQQLTAFQVWLEFGSEKRIRPEQLPIVLQVLLHQVHRLRALVLLAKFMSFGQWAVQLTLCVGIFPYVLKLLRSNAKELQFTLLSIWSRILSVDATCQIEIIRDGGHMYFLNILQDPTSSVEHRIASAFLLSEIVNKFPEGQEVVLKASLVTICLEQLNDPNALLRQWVVICLGKIWEKFEKARWNGVRGIAHEKLYSLLMDPMPQVRTATVYALGTFIDCVRERSEHSNNIDHSVITNLIRFASTDMSYLVRCQLLNTLQFVIKSFVHVFVQIYSEQLYNTGRLLQNTPDEANSTNSNAVAMAESSGGTPHHHHSVRKHIVTYKNTTFRSMYDKVWQVVCYLENDPYPQVEQMARAITKYIQRFVVDNENPVECKSNSGTSLNHQFSTATAGGDTVPVPMCSSLPASPNKYLNHHDGVGHKSTSSMTTKKLTSSSSACSTPTSIQSNLPTTDSKVQVQDENGSSIAIANETIVSTKFVEWSCKKFLEKHMKTSATSRDMESLKYYQRDWRHFRNNNIRREAAEDVRLVMQCKLESQVFSTRTIIPPAVVQFHPYEQQIAVAGRNSFGIWDWGTGAKTTVCHYKSNMLSSSSNITSLEWINGHDTPLIMVGCDDGTIKIWCPNVGHTREPSLITAWQVGNSTATMPATSQTNLCEKVSVVWEQWTRNVITAGIGRCIRIWDAATELHAFDIVTNAHSNVTCLDSTHSGWDHDCTNCTASPSSSMIIAGFNNGTIQLFDKRQSNSELHGRIWMEHPGPIIGVHFQSATSVIAASASGHVKEFDIRHNRSVRTMHVLASNMSTFSQHRNAQIYACTCTLNNSINVFHANGIHLNTIKSYEGFMTHRNASITCLAFHPYKVTLAAGSSDCSMAIYTLEKRR